MMMKFYAGKNIKIITFHQKKDILLFPLPKQLRPQLVHRSHRNNLNLKLIGIQSFGIVSRNENLLET